MIQVRGKYTTADIMLDEVEPSAMAQIVKMTNNEAFTHPIKVMPDAHSGKGSVIGFTMKLPGDKVIPNIIGVDIGCGISMGVLKGDFSDQYVLKDWHDYHIRQAVPLGYKIHDRPVVNFERDFDWAGLKKKAFKFANKFAKDYEIPIWEYIPDYNYHGYFTDLCNRIGMSTRKAEKSIGTLGGGNHFIELGHLNKDVYSLSVHSGSRNLGKRVCEYWQNREFNKKDTTRYDAEVKKIVAAAQTREEKAQINGKIRDLREKFFPKNVGELAYIEGKHAFGYLFDMLFAQEYASLNRRTMLNRMYMAIAKDCMVVCEYESVHNYIDFEDMIIRKGAISAYEDQTMLIPFNMRDGIAIALGKSNPDWNYSAPHGAGRVMSRSAAKAKLDLEKYKADMKDVASTCVNESTLDEAPDAYKDSDMIREAIRPTAKLMRTAKPLLSIKAGTCDRPKGR